MSALILRHIATALTQQQSRGVARQADGDGSEGVAHGGGDVGDANNASSSGGTGADKDRQQQHPTLLLARDALMADAVAPAAPGPDTGAGLDGGPRRAASVAAHGDSRGSNDTPEGGAPASGASWPLLSWSRCRVAAAQIGR
ncbi:hypothetical protein MNEG_13877, partial [Monoraphidium neglectum]